MYKYARLASNANNDISHVQNAGGRRVSTASNIIMVTCQRVIVDDTHVYVICIYIITSDRVGGCAVNIMTLQCIFCS